MNEHLGGCFTCFLGRICSSQIFCCWRDVFLLGTGYFQSGWFNHSAEDLTKVIKVDRFGTHYSCHFPSSCLRLSFLILPFFALDCWNSGVSACQDDHVLDYLNEDGLSVEPRGFSQSGLSQHASWNQQLQLRCINPEFFFLEGILFKICFFLRLVLSRYPYGLGEWRGGYWSLSLVKEQPLHHSTVPTPSTGWKEQVGVLQYPTSIRETHSSRDGASAVAESVLFEALKIAITSVNGITRHWWFQGFF